MAQIKSLRNHYQLAANKKAVRKLTAFQVINQIFILFFPIPALSDLWLAALTQPVLDYREQILKINDQVSVNIADKVWAD